MNLAYVESLKVKVPIDSYPVGARIVSLMKLKEASDTTGTESIGSPLMVFLTEELRNLILLQAKECFTFEEASMVLSVSKRQVQYWVQQGILSSVLLPESNRIRRITRAQIRAFVSSAEYASGFRAPKRSA